LSVFDPVRLLQCPNCKETIDASSLQCRFCLAPIDPVAAQAAADVMAKVNQACSDASFMKTAAGAILVAFVFRFLPIVGGLGNLAFLVLLIAVPAIAIRWWVKFSGIVTDEADFRRAKKTVIAIGIPITVILVLVLALFAVGVTSVLGRR
jgi:glucan phosphoethanolaminetransferase (alkaline phosphatase superfamily)